MLIKKLWLISFKTILFIGMRYLKPWLQIKVWSPNWEGPFKAVQVFSNGAYEIEELTEEQRTLGINGKYLKKYKPMLQEVKINEE
jgi:hypothetical protein